ncbi:MAG: hypothetical protein HYV36_08315 [Lentisphaerae bacterium]|nr:hypothetical protein [Lentisphaerota bacterium]
MGNDSTPHKLKNDRDIGAVRYRQQIGVSLPKAVIGVAVFYVMAGLLNGENILQQARLMEYGRARTVCVALAKPLAALSKATGFNQPGIWLQRLRK